MKMYYDHCYSVDMHHKFHAKLENVGFQLNPVMTEHPGKYFCKFISLPDTKRTGRQYLEFIHLGNGNIQDEPNPGLSLRTATPLKKMAKKLGKQKIKTTYAHKNYDWKKNEVDILPGWNFVTFPKHQSGIYTWLTEYEKGRRRRNKSTKTLKHPNKVYRLVCLDAELEQKDILLFTKFFGAPKNGHYKMACQNVIRFTKARKSKLKSVVLATSDLSRLVRKFQWDELVSFDGKPGVLIINPNPGMWNLVIVEM